ncbi:MAG: ATP phosphoribosyltransferase [Gammaproteobacteria bacterium]
MKQNITIAIAKGRILKEALPLLQQAGISPRDNPDESRKLVLQTEDPALRLVIVRAADVPTYVQRGGADLGITGKDVLLENSGDNLYEPVDLNIARCKLVLAGLKDRPTINGRPKIATKYVTTTRRYFAAQGKEVEIIKLYGSMELAPSLGLADQIVDLVDTGSTLQAHGLVPLETIADISSRLVVNKAAMKMKRETIVPLLEALQAAVD